MTLVTNLVYRRSLFDWQRFWNNEPMWFPHAYSVVGNAINQKANAVVVGSNHLVVQSGNTEKERLSGSRNHYNIMLNSQFQKAILEFINMCAREARIDADKLLTSDIYIKLVTKTFRCTTSAVVGGMGNIDTFLANKC